MTEQFDDEISRALKEDTAKSLAGWEFTPSMQRKVFERIRAEEQAGPTAPARRVNPTPLMRPLTWVAVAAAAFLIVVNMDLSRLGLGGSKKDSATSQAPAAAPGSQEVDDKGMVRDNTGNGGNATEYAITAAPADGPGAADSRGQGNVNLRSFSVVQVVELTVPQSSGEPADVPPPGAVKKDNEPISALGVATTTMNLVIQAAPRQAVSLTTNGVAALDSYGNESWNMALAGVSEESPMAVALSGRIAVATGNQVHVLNDRGEPEQLLEAGSPVIRLAWSPAGELAAVTESAVTVYEGKNINFTVKAGPETAVALAPDGALAVITRQDSYRNLSVYDRHGRTLVASTAVGEGSGLSFDATGNVILAGRHAYDRTGQVIWKAPFAATGAQPLNPSVFLLWDQRSVLAVKPDSGATLWQAAWNGAGEGIQRVVTSPDGGQVAILAFTDQGDAAWVLTAEGRELFSTKLLARPVDLAVMESRLLLQQPANLDVREIPR